MKTYIYNKVKNAGRGVSRLMILASTPFLFASCLDTIILPDDKTVDEDFWQTKEQVASMVNGAYAAMTSSDLLARLIVWGDFRTDEVLRYTGADVSTTTDALDEIAAVNIQPTNMFATWSTLYNVINRCNIVLERSEAVMSIDPNYTMGDYQVDRSQMLALRSLCYFYLVRNFRDVPYTATAYMNSSQNRQLAQSSPLEVLNKCIEDLEEAAKTPLSAQGVSGWRKVGWFTEDGINALLADIYLWRASATHSQADYQQCVAYCDKVIESKRSQHVPGRNEIEKDYPLADGGDMYTALFVEQNAEESIFEIQTNSNMALCQYYYKYKSATGFSGSGWLKATPLFYATSSTYDKTTSISNSTLFSANDLRYYAACYIPTSTQESYDIRKLVTESAVSSKKTVPQRESYNYGGFDRNYNVYRLTDVMLMKAEALVQQVDTALTASEQADLLRVPFTLVQAVNTRALDEGSKGDSIKWATFRTFSKDQFEQLVLQERMREFCFEGRRWYDLLRYNYRHMDGVAYDKTLNQIVEGQESLPDNSKEMLTLMTRQRGTEASGVMAKMANEAYLYLPIPNSDMLVCPLLKQNPAYGSSNEYEKNY